MEKMAQFLSFGGEYLQHLDKMIERGVAQVGGPFGEHDFEVLVASDDAVEQWDVLEEHLVKTSQEDKTGK